ncbi:site-specific integrase [Candidatus Woesearchaeota archaeon]|nr:site-specific integrase [Candidatus Woesearchaeota archaeon]
MPLALAGWLRSLRCSGRRRWGWLRLWVLRFIWLGSGKEIAQGNKIGRLTYCVEIPNSLQSRQGEGLKPNQIRNIAKAAGKRIGMGDQVSCHWLRHSHAGHNVQRGTALTLIQETLGHESLNTTRNYLAANPSDSSALHLPV